MSRASTPSAQSVPAASVRSSSRASASAASSARAAAHAGLDQLDEREAGDAEVVVLARLAGARAGLVVAAEPVVQHGRHVADRTDRPSLAAGFAFVIDRRRRGATAADSSPCQAASRTVVNINGAWPVIAVIASDSSIRADAAAELAGVHVHGGAVDEGDRKLAERARVARELRRHASPARPTSRRPTARRRASHASQNQCIVRHRRRSQPCSSEGAQRSPERGDRRGVVRR